MHCFIGNNLFPFGYPCFIPHWTMHAAQQCRPPQSQCSGTRNRPGWKCWYESTKAYARAAVLHPFAYTSFLPFVFHSSNRSPTRNFWLWSSILFVYPPAYTLSSLHMISQRYDDDGSNAKDKKNSFFSIPNSNTPGSIWFVWIFCVRASLYALSASNHPPHSFWFKWPKTLPFRSAHFVHDQKFTTKERKVDFNFNYKLGINKVNSLPQLNKFQWCQCNTKLNLARSLFST